MLNVALTEEKAQEYKVGIADLKATTSPHRIITLGLGSCVGIILYDNLTKIGGMVHIMLPESTKFKQADNPAKFADTGITLLLQEILKLGANKKRLFAKIAGGAQMFKSNASNLLNIGERNTEKTREILADLKIPLVAEHTGGSIGRTLILDNYSGKVFVRVIGNKPKEI